MTTMTEPDTHTLDVPGAVLTYDVRSADSPTAPALLMIGSPMGAGGFVTLAGHFIDRTVVTYDPAEDDANRSDPLLGQNIISCTHYEPDFEVLRSASTWIVVAAGAESEGEMAHRGAVAVAERLGTTPVSFPSGHGGFLGGEYGQTGDPVAFAAKLHQILTEAQAR